MKTQNKKVKNKNQIGPLIELGKARKFALDRKKVANEFGSNFANSENLISNSSKIKQKKSRKFFEISKTF